MRSLMLIAMVALSTTAYAEENSGKDSSKFKAYQQRLAQRRDYALELRRQYNATKGPAVYRTSTVYQGSLPRYVAIEQGWVNQPPIPMRPVFVAPYPTVNYTSNYVPAARPESSPLVRTFLVR